MKIGLDFHGVIDKSPRLFRLLGRAFDLIESNEIHIITGCRERDIKMWLENNDIYYDYIYSITDDLLRRKKPYKKDKKNNPYFDEKLWNTAKAKYCKKHKIDIMLDNSNIYGNYFVTPYFKMEFRSNKRRYK